MKNNVIVLVPHGDDETLGLGATINKLSQLYNITCCLFVEPDYDYERDEFIRACKHLGAIPCLLNIGNNGRLFEVDTLMAVSILDDIIQKLKPNIVFIPSPSVHQDHQFVYSIGVASCRSGTMNNHYSPPMVLLYNPSMYSEKNIYNLSEVVYCEVSKKNMVKDVGYLEIKLKKEI